MAKLFKKKNKKPERVEEKEIVEEVREEKEEKKLSGSAELAAKINSIIRGK
jgi:hypothetical protein